MSISTSIRSLPFLTKVANLLKSSFRNPSGPKLEYRVMPQHSAPVREIKEIKKRYQKSGLNDEKLNHYETTLIRFIEKSKVYLDAELTLDDLSAQTKIPKHHITQLLND